MSVDVSNLPVPRINLVDPGLYCDGDPFVQWRWLRENDPVHLHEATDYPAFWALTKYDDVKAVFRDAETFSSARGILLRPSGHGADPGGGRTLALTDPPRHRQLRGLVDEWFTVRSVRAIEAKMREVAGSVIDLAVEREQCDFVEDIAARIPLYMICSMMGVPQADWEKLFRLSREAFGAGDAMTRRFAHMDIMGHFQNLAAEKAANPGDDLVSVLVAGRIDGERLSEEEILLNCDNLFVGGAENTRIAASGGMLAFMEHPQQWRLLVDDPGLLPTAVDEVLRWTSTPTHIMRTATRPVEIRGRQIAAGDLVTLWLPSANRDEDVFDDPDRFDVRRQPNRHLALGFGEHFCVGSVLARVEIRFLYQEIIERKLDVEAAGEPVPLDSIVVNGPKSLPVRLVPRR
ncbi:cytochrome P450 [Dactylosporangium sp. NPDC006015]|uniref:cytochrome P450 n=1 Tax=Dactylosporangium sp. NPDC006015 TaxID=3154576 RepID=UPI0033A25461